MAEKKAENESTDSRSREIQASIAEGNMMLQVLRSLPASENNNAFILRFEELISRLERYRAQPKQTPVNEEEVHTQLRALKMKQDKIRSLLDQTAQEFQTSLCPTSESDRSPDHPVENITDSATQILRMLSNSGTVSTDDRGSPKPVCAEKTDGVGSVTKSIANQHISESFDSAVSDLPAATPVASPVTVSKRVSLCDGQIAKLNNAIDDSKRFQSMVDRLIHITRRARLTEASGFLLDISARFSELERNLDSLREIYETTRNEPELDEDLQETRLSNYQEFFNSLERNLETTKECFFTMYHLIKSNIDQGMADGSLEIESDNEETAPRVQSEHSVSAAAPIENKATEASDKQGTVNIPKTDADSVLTAQKAYLTLLQERTASERDEINRLLQQRDQLAARLQTLRSAVAAKQITNLYSETEPNESTLVEEEPTEADQAGEDQPKAPEPNEVQPMLTHLAAKRRELQSLKDQLNLLRKAEANMHILDDSSKQIVSTIVNTGGAGDSASTGTSKSEVTKNSTASARGTLSHRSPQISPVTLLKTRFLNSQDIGNALHDNNAPGHATNDQLIGTGPGKLDTVTFQQPEATCINDSTERLYETMREARIRLEEQRGHGAAAAMVSRDLSDKEKALQRVYGGGASVATSQDRTTLATWGGSSPVPSGSTSRSSGPVEDEEAISGSSSLPRIGRILPTSNVNSEPGTALTAVSSTNSTVYRNKAERHSSRHTNSTQRSLKQTTRLSDPVAIGTVRLPQVGRSPSPARHRADAMAQMNSDMTTQKGSIHPVAGTDQALSRAMPFYSKLLSPLSAANPDGGDSFETFDSAALTERVRSLENSVSQLFQICHCLLTENAQLNTTLTHVIAQSTHTAPRSQWPHGIPASTPTQTSGGLFSSLAAMPALIDARLSQGQSQLLQLSSLLGGSGPQTNGAMVFQQAQGSNISDLDTKQNPTTNDQDPLQTMLRRLMQQQIQYFNTQSELQCLLYRQIQSGPSAANLVLPPTNSALSSQLMSPTLPTVLPSSVTLNPGSSFWVGQHVPPAVPLPSWGLQIPSPAFTSGTNASCNTATSWQNANGSDLRMFTLSAPTAPSASTPMNTQLDPQLNLLSSQSSVVGVNNQSNLAGNLLANTELRNGQFWIPPNLNIVSRGAM